MCLVMSRQADWTIHEIMCMRQKTKNNGNDNDNDNNDNNDNNNNNNNNNHLPENRSISSS